MTRWPCAGRAGDAVRTLLVVSFAVFLTVPAGAQSVSARVEGIVTDESGAAVPGAAVTATHQATSVSRSVFTDARGGYVLTPLPVGTYQIKASLTGFKESTTTATLTVNQVARIDFKLQVGGQTEVVEVLGAAPIIDKTTSAIGTVIDQKQVASLPLNGRNFTQLATLSPGVTRGVPGSNADGSQGNAETFRYGEVGGGAISVNGLREQFNSYLLDGVDNNESLVNSLVFFPPVESLQEFRVITTNAPAEFGRAGGAITNLITKSGTNQVHGSAYEFNRSKSLAATPTFAAPDPACAGQSGCQALKPDFNRNQFGVTIGGPIVKDKTFFFLSYSGLRSTQPVEVGGKVTVPTAKMRNGDFSELLNPAFTGLGAPVLIYDPVTGRPYPGNVVPASQINPVGQRYLGVFPLPDLTDRAQQNFFTHRVRTSKFHDGDARLDHVFGPADSLFLRLSYANDKRFDPGRIPGFQAGFGSGSANAEGFGFALGETHTFSPHVINEARFGFFNYRYEFLPVGFGTDQDQAIGIPGIGGITQANGISLIGGGNGSFLEYLGDFGQYIVRQKTYQLSDSINWLRGSHNFRFGGVLLLRDLDFERSNFGKGFYFFSDFAATPGNKPSLGSTGYEVAEMLVARTAFTTSAIPGFIPTETLSWENSLFVQDDWRVSRRLTLNLGLRYDVFTPYREKDDKMSNYDPATNKLVLAGQGGVPRATVNTDYDNFGPRAGLAYQIDDKTVVRGAYGIFYSLDRGGVDNQLFENPPTKVTQFRFDGPGATVRLSDAIPVPDRVDAANPVIPLGSGIVFVPRDTKTTMVQQYSFGLQREITGSTAVMVAYVGTHGDHLTAVTTRADFGGDIAKRLTTVANIGVSRYNSLQVSLRRNPVAGLSYLASYTLGHATNDTPGPFPGPGAAFTATPTDARNLGLDEGDADFDVRHRCTFASSYELPFAKGNGALGGWSLNTIVTLQSGTPFSVFANGRRADQNGDPNRRPHTTDMWFDTSVFAPAKGDVPTEKRNAVRGPGIKTVDLSLFKTLKTGGRTTLEIRIEGFNVFNHPQLQIPNPSAGGQFIGAGDYGKITSTRLNSERQIQLAARFLF